MIITIDIDWACEPAIEEILSFLDDKKIIPTVFSTHNSAVIEAVMNKIDVGLHPYFSFNSSHGSTITEVVKYVIDLPHNLPAFRCHRFAICNTSKQAMVEAGMLLSSNVCTDLEIMAPFRDRSGLIEIPIFLEDGGYLWRKRPIKLDKKLESLILRQEIKVISIHPMHFALNTPNFSYMHTIKQSVSREAWKNMTRTTLNKLKWNKYGIRNLIIELLQIAPTTSSLRTLINTS